jgi:putative phosphoesterase
MRNQILLKSPKKGKYIPTLRALSDYFLALINILKICVFSDIHGNGAAFESAYKMILSEHAEFNIFLGDLCGYYYDQNKIFDMLMTIPNLIAVLGNHDSMFLSIIEGDNELRKTYIEKYGHSMEFLFRSNFSDIKEWLSKLTETYTFHDASFACYHGSPEDTLNGYVYPDSSLDDFIGYPAKFFLLGHTHYPMKRKILGKLIVNPGSLGQPRHGGLPTYAVLSPFSGEVSLKEVTYDNSSLLKQIHEAGDYDLYLREILDRGRKTR